MANLDELKQSIRVLIQQTVTDVKSGIVVSGVITGTEGRALLMARGTDYAEVCSRFLSYVTNVDGIESAQLRVTEYDPVNDNEEADIELKHLQALSDMGEDVATELAELTGENADNNHLAAMDL